MARTQTMSRIDALENATDDGAAALSETRKKISFNTSEFFADSGNPNGGGGKEVDMSLEAIKARLAGEYARSIRDHGGNPEWWRRGKEVGNAAYTIKITRGSPTEARKNAGRYFITHREDTRFSFVRFVDEDYDTVCDRCTRMGWLPPSSEYAVTYSNWWRRPTSG